MGTGAPAAPDWRQYLVPRHFLRELASWYGSPLPWTAVRKCAPRSRDPRNSGRSRRGIEGDRGAEPPVLQLVGAGQEQRPVAIYCASTPAPTSQWQGGENTGRRAELGTIEIRKKLCRSGQERAGCLSDRLSVGAREIWYRRSGQVVCRSEGAERAGRGGGRPCTCGGMWSGVSTSPFLTFGISIGQFLKQELLAPASRSSILLVLVVREVLRFVEEAGSIEGLRVRAERAFSCGKGVFVRKGILQRSRQRGCPIPLSSQN